MTGLLPVGRPMNAHAEANVDGDKLYFSVAN